jgi:hypothetical protein
MFNIGIYESPFNDGPMASLPYMSGTVSTTTNVIQLKDNLYQIKMATNLDNGWRSHRIQIPLSKPKRVRVDVRCVPTNPLAPEDLHLQNIAIFGQFKKSNVQHNIDLGIGGMT